MHDYNLDSLQIECKAEDAPFNSSLPLLMAQRFHYPLIQVSLTEYSVIHLFQTIHLIMERTIKPVQMSLFQWIILFSGGGAPLLLYRGGPPITLLTHIPL